MSFLLDRSNTIEAQGELQYSLEHEMNQTLEGTKISRNLIEHRNDNTMRATHAKAFKVLGQ
jgi:hypothetical protein